MLHTQNLFRFSQSTLAAKTFAKYAEKLTVEKNHLVDAIEAAPVKKSTQRAYVHPYHNNFRRINVSTREIIEAADNLVGV